jgi:hypothetical protein
MRATVEPLVGVLATIPVGFVVYQAYYFNYGPTVKPWPLPWDGKTVRADRGFQVLGHLPSPLIKKLSSRFDLKLDLTKAHERVPDPGSFCHHPVKKIFHWLRVLRLTPEWQCIGDRKVCKEAYVSRWHDNWDVLRAIVEVAGSLPGGTHLKDEYMTLSDLFHALGAARTAVFASWLAAVLLAFSHTGRVTENPFECAIGLALITLLSSMLWVIFHIARRRTWKSARSSLRLSLRWLFLDDVDALGPGPA